MEKQAKTPLPSLGTIPVRNVQALSANPKVLTPEILEKYICHEMEDDLVVSGDNLGAVPIIDMRRLMDNEFMKEELDRLKVACEDWGFFQFVNHGIEKVMEEMKINIKKFFELPLEEKQKIAKGPGKKEGYGQPFVYSEEQRLDWTDILSLVTQPTQFRNLKFWPTQPPSFRESLDRYSTEVQNIAHCILRFMAINLGLNQEKLTQIYGSQTVRINYYPPCQNSHDKIVGLTPHSDSGGLTLLMQANSVAGLQIRKDDVWLPVDPLPGALVVNIGDSLEVFTNGKYKSIVHRVVINPSKERMSIGTFHRPNFGEMVGPLAEIVGDGKPLYRTLSMEDYGKLFLTKKPFERTLIEQMKLNA